MDLLKLIGPLTKENEFKNRFRLHQGWWRAFILGENPGEHPMKKGKLICNTITDGKLSTKNLLSKSVVKVIEEVLIDRENNGAGIVNENRLFNNLLSSQPLCFNFFAPFYLDKNLALNFLKIFYPEITSVNRVLFEFANEKNKFDNSAFDVAFDVNSEKQKGIIGFEVKYTDSFSSKSYQKDSYKTIFNKSNIWKSKYEELTNSKFNQLFRNQLVGESFKQDYQFDFAYLALFCHHEDFEAIETASKYKSMLHSTMRNHFKVITYREFFDNIIANNLKWELKEYFMLLWARYCGIQLSRSAFQQYLVKRNEI